MRSVQESNYAAIVNRSAHLIFQIFELNQLRTRVRKALPPDRKNAANKSSNKIISDVEALRLKAAAEAVVMTQPSVTNGIRTGL